MKAVVVVASLRVRIVAPVDGVLELFYPNGKFLLLVGNGEGFEEYAFA